MIETLLNLSPYWLWWSLGALLLIAELTMPAYFFIWLSAAAWISGLIAFLMPEMAWKVQILLYALLSVATLFAWRRYLRHKPPPPAENPNLNRRGAQYVGRIETLDQPIVHGRGSLSLDDTFWTLSGPDLDAGQQVEIIAQDGNILKVAPYPREAAQPQPSTHTPE